MLLFPCGYPTINHIWQWPCLSGALQSHSASHSAFRALKSFTHSLTHPPTHPPTHSLTHSQWASTSAELLATLAALEAFGWTKEGRHRKDLQVSLTAGTDNRANEALSAKRATTRWPLMAINMQLSSRLSKARAVLNLRWRLREENTEADDLTNEKFDEFDPALRITMTLQDMEMPILLALVATRAEFEEAKLLAKNDRKFDWGSKSKKFDKSPW